MPVYLEEFLGQNQGDAAAAFAVALRRCAQTGERMLQLPAGELRLAASQTHQTLSIAHDDGCGDIRQKQVHILLQGLHGLTIQGAVDDLGNPATVLCGHNSGEVQALLPSVLWAEGCKGLQLRNLAFTRKPECVCAGWVLAVAQGSVEVEVAEGLHHYPGMGAYCMNRIDEEGRLAGASLTYGFGFEERWRHLGGRRYALAVPTDIAEAVQVGETLVWHQAGKTDFLLYFGGCDGLRFENLRVYNTNSFALLTECCRDISAKKLVIKPKQGRYFTGPRDGWKIYRCTGDIQLHHCHIEGVRMDGQNVQSNYLTIREAKGKTLLCACKYAPLPLRDGTALTVYSETGEQQCVISRWQHAGEEFHTPKAGTDETAGAVVGQANRVSLYSITLEAAPTQPVRQGDLCVAACWQPASYTCEDTVFKNIAGAGQLLRCSDIAVRRCRYENMMNAGVLLGAELSTHSEADHVRRVLVEGCEFIRCGTKPRYGRFGCGGIAVKSQGFAKPLNRDIILRGNRFLQCGTGVELNDAEDVVLADNCFERVENHLVADPETTRHITEEA